MMKYGWETPREKLERELESLRQSAWVNQAEMWNQIATLTRKLAVAREALWAARDRLAIHGDLSRHPILAKIDAALAGKSP